MRISFTLLVILICSASTSPISHETLANLYNDALLPCLNNEFSKILNSVQNSNALTSLSTRDLGDQLYNNVIVGDYETAVTKSLQLEQAGKSQVIIDTVNKLLSDGKRNVVEFAYSLWNMFGKSIVKDYFPIQFRMILNGDGVALFNKKDEFPLTVVVNADKDGNRLAFGDGKDRNSERLRWNIKTIWEDNRLYFKIVNTLRHEHLKLTIAADSNSEHKGYSAVASDTNRMQWYLHPAMYEGDLLFYIINREFNQALKLNSAVDSSGNRYAYSHKSDFVGNPELLGWYIKPY